MNKPKQASISQHTLGGFGSGNVVSLDGGKRLRLDDKVGVVKPGLLGSDDFFTRAFDWMR